MKSYVKPKFGSILFDVSNYVFMIVFSITVLYPFWSLIVLSFSDAKTASTLGFHIWNSSWSIDSYKFIIKSSDVLNAYGNTILVTVVTTILSLIMCLLAAYPLSKRDLPCRNIITIFFLVPMFFSGGLIPYYMIIKGLQLYDTIWVLIIPGIFSSFNMIIMRNFLQSMNKELEEAASIDGATYLDIIRKIIIPLMTPVLATIALWTMVANWNAWFNAMIFTRSERILVLQILVRRMIMLTEKDRNLLDQFINISGKVVPSATVRAATIIITIGPIVMAYPFLQKYFIKGIMIGSLKG